MRSQEIEVWTRRVVERALAGLPNEDSRVELKAELPTDASRAARRLAGHCNAAGGHVVLWVVGVDEKARQIVSIPSIPPIDLASWWQSVKVEFDLLAPQLTDLIVPTQRGDVLSLLFATDRVPFVVKNPAFGRLLGDSVQFEVPWREGTSTRSARRDDLLVLLVPTIQLPQVEILDARVQSVRGTTLLNTDPYPNWDIGVDLYLVPRSEQPVTIPFHASQLFLTLPGHGGTVVAPELRMVRQSTPGGSPNNSPAVVSSYSEVTVSSPSAVVVYANFATSRPCEADGSAVGVGLTFTPALAEHAISLGISVPQHGETDANGRTVWQLRQDRPEYRYQAGGESLPPLVD